MVERACPSEPTLKELVSGRLSRAAAPEIFAHTETCPTCSLYLLSFGETAAAAVAKLELGQPGEFVAEFRLIRPLGQGAMGQVFLAHDTFLDRQVAIKFLNGSDSGTVARERFFIEARAVARLQHPNVVTLYRAGEERGRRYLVSEYVGGKSLERWPKPLPSGQVLDIGLGLARGLAAAHQRGVLHRDIKPANAIVTEQGEVKLLDFGLAKLVDQAVAAEEIAPAPPGPSPASAVSLGESEVLLSPGVAITRSGALLGTPLYMAPEAWRGRPATAQTDVYSLGALLYELCTGHPPHRAETVAALGARAVRSDSTPVAVAAPGVDARLAAVIDRCLQRNPAKRFSSGEQVREALERITARSAFLSRRMAAFGGSVLGVVLLVLSGVAVARDRQAKQQAVLAQRLGQEIKDMEWLLRSARQLPLHDLNREKVIVRKHMVRLEAELLGYGSVGRSLAHYALGRGYLALHEYPQALTELEQAMQLGYQSADVYYALGLVLGLHYRQARDDLRGMGPSSWIKKRLQPLESRYLKPAIAALKRSRDLKLDAPQYLEGLIDFYQGDYEAALRHAQAAQIEAPWLYEAANLAGDIHRERANFLEKSGSIEDADKDLASAVRSYEAAAAIGQSDAEVYENLTAAWASRIFRAAKRHQPTALLYAAAIAASDKNIRAEPETITGWLRRTQYLILPVLESNISTSERLTECLRGTEQVLKKQPTHPVATYFAAVCYTTAAQLAGLRGEQQGSLLRQAINLLEPIVRRDPSHFQAWNDLSGDYVSLAELLLSQGNPEAKRCLEKGLEAAHTATDLDAGSSWPWYTVLNIRALQISSAAGESELQSLLTRLDAEVATIKAHNQHSLDAYAMYSLSWAYANAALRTHLIGQDPQPRLKRALESLERARTSGNDNAELEVTASLIHYIDASSRVADKQDPGAALQQGEEALQRCLALAAQNPYCQTIAAQAAFVQSDWLAQQQQPTLPALRRALQRAIAATQSPQQTADAWQVLAEAHLRLYLAANPAVAGSSHIAEGLAAVQKVFATNPTHARGLATLGALLLARGKAERDLAPRQQDVQEAVTALEQALKSDPLLEHQYVAALATARALVQRAAPLGAGRRVNGQPL